MIQRSQPKSRIESITTHISIIDNPTRFVLHYSRAVHAYLGALVRDVNDADDVTQELLARVLERGLSWSGNSAPRFRDYLKAVLRNVAVDWYRSRKRRPITGTDIDAIARREAAAVEQWLPDWRDCILEAAWRTLEAHEQQKPDNYCYYSLRLASEHPTEPSAQLAVRLSQKIGRPIRADAFRKQLSRSRRLFASLIVNEVRQTLSNPCQDRVDDELIHLGLFEYVRHYQARNCEE